MTINIYREKVSMAHRRENQEKLAFQAKLRDSFNTVNSTVLSWLGGEQESNGRPQDLNRSKQEFFTLPLVSTGAGLSFNDSKQSEDINTVGEFVNSDKKVKTLSKKRRKPQDKSQNNTANGNNLYKVSKEDTKAMLALKRKMRKGKIEEMRQDPSGITEKLEQKTQQLPATQDTDSEDDPPIEKTQKKSFGLLFDNPKKKRK